MQAILVAQSTLIAQPILIVQAVAVLLASRIRRRQRWSRTGHDQRHDDEQKQKLFHGLFLSL